MATETGTTVTPDTQSVNTLTSQAYELLATTAAEMIGSEDEQTEPGTTTAVAQKPETETATAEDEQVLSQDKEEKAEGEGEAETAGESQTVPLKRLNKEVARRKKLEEEIRTLKEKSTKSEPEAEAEAIGGKDAEVTRLEQEETVARATYGLASDLIGKLRRATALDDEEAKAKLIGEVESTLKEKKVALRDFSGDVMARYLEGVADDSREKLDDLRVRKHVQQARSEERASFERQQNDAKALASYEWLKEEDSKEYQFAQGVGGMFPGLRKHPAGLLFMADAVSGALARLAKEKAGQAKPVTTSTNTTTPPKVTRSGTAAPLPPAKGELSGLSKRVLENPDDTEARTKFFGSLLG